MNLMPVLPYHLITIKATMQTNQLSVESAIALATELASHNMGGWIEDIIDWWVDGGSGRPLKEVTDGTSYEATICTGEDMFGFRPVQEFRRYGGVKIDSIPEANTAGGLNQTLLAAKYAS